MEGIVPELEVGCKCNFPFTHSPGRGILPLEGIMAIWQQVFWKNSLLQWTISLAELLLLFALLELLRLFLIRKVRKLASRTKTRWDDLLVLVLEKTRHLTIFVVTLHFAALSLTLPPRLTRFLFSLVVLALLYQAGRWATSAIRFWLDGYRQEKLKDDAAAVTTMGALAFLGRAIVWSTVLLLALDNLGINVTGLITGLGIGGIAVALAAQNILGDLFASLSIVLDKPFVIGDSISFDGVQGTVERIGLKTTRLRNLTGEELVVANSDLLRSRIANFGRMAERRGVLALAIATDTPVTKVAALPGVIGEAIGTVAGIRLARSHFKGFGQYSLDFEAVFWVPGSDYERFMTAQQQVHLAVLTRLRELEVALATPALTVRTAATATGQGG